jgi:predicted DNA-binding transcriptional regulator YafY
LESFFCFKRQQQEVEPQHILQLIVNYEFEHFILSYADSVKVIQPQSLAEQIKSRMKKVCGLYDGDKFKNA